MDPKSDKYTTYLATVKISIGIIGVAVAVFGGTWNETIRESLLSLAGSGYLVFSWLQGFWTNKRVNGNKPPEAVDGGVVDTAPVVSQNIAIDSESETLRINAEAERVRQMEGREFLDPSDIALKSLINKEF